MQVASRGPNRRESRCQTVSSSGVTGKIKQMARRWSRAVAFKGCAASHTAWGQPLSPPPSPSFSVTRIVFFLMKPLNHHWTHPTTPRRNSSGLPVPCGVDHGCATVANAKAFERIGAIYKGNFWKKQFAL